MKEKARKKRQSAHERFFGRLLAKLGVLMLGFVIADSAIAQNYSNYGYNSENYETATEGAATLEYDNYISGFHSTIIRGHDGVFRIWGECTKNDGVSHHLIPTAIDRINFPILTGTPLKAAIGSSNIYGTGTNGPQHFLLTSDNKIWVWGKTGIVLDASLTSSSQFRQLSPGLPPGVTASQVKMLFATRGSLVITTGPANGGAVWVLSQFQAHRGAGSASSNSTSWSRVQKSSGGNLTGIIATRGTLDGLMALDNAGGLWTWGDDTFLGNGSAAAGRNVATQMTIPYTGSRIKMIGMTRGAAYYVLYENGRLYAMGNNRYKQLGDFKAADIASNSLSWTRPRYSSASTNYMNDIAWISPQEHDGALYGIINVINNSKILWNWGLNAHKMLGRITSGDLDEVDPGQPESWESGHINAGIIGTETGGHTTMLLQECSQKFGYIGHRINGSMGDNDPNTDPNDGRDVTVRFNTAAISVEGVNTGAAVLYPVSGHVEAGVPTQLSFSPAGGTFAVTGGAATITQQGQLTAAGAGIVTVTYTVEGACAVTSSSITVNVTSALGVGFGTIQAQLAGGALEVLWTTLNEERNSHFEIEGSSDGKTFIKIGEVKSLATNGNSDGLLNYRFNGAASAMAVGLGLGLVAMGGIYFRRNMILGAVIFVAGVAFSVAGCKKVNDAPLFDGKLFIRIVQVDKDGTKSYSKAVEALTKSF